MFPEHKILVHHYLAVVLVVVLAQIKVIVVEAADQELRAALALEEMVMVTALVVVEQEDMVLFLCHIAVIVMAIQELQVVQHPFLLHYLQSTLVVMVDLVKMV